MGRLVGGLAYLLVAVVFCASRPFFAEASLSDRLAYYELIRIERRIVKRGTPSASPAAYNRQERISFSGFGRRFDVYLTPKTGILHSKFVCREVDEDGNEWVRNVNPDEHFGGHVHGSKDSVVSVTFDNYGAMLGIIRVDGETYAFEPARLHGMAREPEDILAYKTSDMKLHITVSNATFCSSLAADSAAQSIREEFVERLKRSDEVVHKNRCSLRLVADYHFFKTIGNGSLAFSTRYLVNVIDRVNALYTATDWGRDSRGRRLTNLGFMIKEMLIHTAPTRSPSFHYNFFSDSKRNVNALLENFSRERGSDKYCLVHLFTAQPFENGVLGLGYVSSPVLHSAGGICSTQVHDSTGYVYYNTALSSTKATHGGTVISREADIVTAHELGHNWGATHDDSSAECSPAYSDGGSFIMSMYSVSGYDSNNNRFSPCSVRMIEKVLSKKADICFEEEKSAFCGNGRVENGTDDESFEECDVGGLLSGIEDKCCQSNCRLRPGAQCSPKNVPCCSSDCKFLSSDHLCLHENPLQCRHSSYCTGVSGECPEPKAIANGTECLDQGECLSGVCLSFCERPSINKKPCMCQNEYDSCLRCCRSDNGSCEPYSHDPKYVLSDGTRCFHGHCLRATCIKEVADVISHFWSIIDSIDETNFWKFVEDNLVGLIVLVMLFAWVPFSIVVHHIDKIRSTKAEIEEQDRVEVVPGEKLVYDYHPLRAFQQYRT